MSFRDEGIGVASLQTCCPTPSIAVFGLEGVPEGSTSEQREYLSDRMG